ncbi:acyl-CoA dehydrogenase family protein [Rhodococcus opacus]|uniref:acyl-CoA dehydrogenase family protein n=1 Tax=Rhodococcus opacus TaxID=37919 RepID=UPI00247710B1|nr:acyl-CoA dehydrogenase family protein [Rhodococcus opacus]MDH6291328.1 alkylation response protein AidB-like acyl-CoA dehydrogenase [Rhodococcus opacus]
MYIADVEIEEHSELREVVRDLVDTLSPMSAVRTAAESESGHDPKMWQALVDMGLVGLTVPEQFGGAGAGVAEQAIAFQELGRRLVPSPLFSSAVASALIEAIGDAQASERYLAKIADGSLVVAVALRSDDGQWSSAGVASDVTQSGDSWSITGSRSFVIDALLADVILVPAKTQSGLSLFAIDTAESGVSREKLTTLDFTRRMGDVAFDNVPAMLLGVEGQAKDAVDEAFRRAILVTVCEQAGAAELLMGMAVDYAKSRYQFGRLIGEFQAIKHKLAEMALDVERMKSVQQHLVRVTAQNSPGRVVLTHLAKAYCSEALFRIAADTIQTLGGLGYTWEHDAHLYFRRAKSAEVLLGTPEIHRELMLGVLENT